MHLHTVPLRLGAAGGLHLSTVFPHGRPLTRAVETTRYTEHGSRASDRFSRWKLRH